MLAGAVSLWPCSAVELFGPRLGLRTGHGPTHVVRADFDGNAVPDFAVANWMDGSVSVMLGDGLGGFDETPDIAAADYPSSIAAGDFNADGNADLVVADLREDALILLLGDGEGGFAHGDLIPTGSDPQFVVAGDFDFDGDEDLAVANSGDDTVSALLSDGNGGFSVAATIPVGTFPNFVAVADLDGDGVPDLAVSNSHSDSVSILLGNGSGGFEPAEAIFVGEERFPTAVAVDDFDLDGKADLAVAHGAHDSLSFWFGDGTGSFGREQEIPDDDPELWKAPVWIATGDFDADGDPDLAVANLNGDTITVLRGDALALQADAPGFAVTAEIALPEGPRSLTVDDFSADGALDLAVVLAGIDMVTILPGDGFGGFLPVEEIADIPLRLLVANVRPASVAAADFDGDGDADVAVASVVANSVMLVRRHEDGYFDVENMTAVEVITPSSVAADDFNGDGKLDLAVTEVLQDSVRILLGDGEGGLLPGQESSTGVDPVAIAAADFDLDGDVDLAVANSNRQLPVGSVTVLLNDGSGGFPDADTRSVTAGSNPFSVTTADFDGDGVPDLAVANTNSDHVSIHRGDGNGNFAGLVGGPTMRIDSPEPIAGDYQVGTAAFGPRLTAEGVEGLVELADDGVDPLTDGCQPLTNNFEGRIALIELLDWPPCRYFTEMVKDAQLAGAAAVIVGNQFSDHEPGTVIEGYDPTITIPTVLIYGFEADSIKEALAAGDDVSVTLLHPDADRVVGVGIRRPVSVVAGDFDGDERIDLAVANSWVSTVSILLGDGQGRFADTLQIPAGEGPNNSLVAADLNLDGFDDLAYALGGDHAVGVLISNGEGGFAPMPVFHSGPAPTSLAAADLDGDGVSDLTAAHSLRDSLSLLYNRIHDRVDPNGSNRVDGFDLAEISRLTGAGPGQSGYRRTHDIDLNGVIDGDDLALVASQFGVLMKTASPLRPTLEQTQPSTPGTVTLQPRESVGDVLTVDVMVNATGQLASSAEFVVTTEPPIAMEAVGFDTGDNPFGAIPAIDPDFDTPGRAELRITRLPTEDTALTGMKSLLGLKLRCKAQGAVTLNFAAMDGRANPTLLDASGNPVGAVTFFGGAEVSVEATGSEAVGQKIGFAPPLLQFGDVPPGQAVKERVRLSNFGFSDLRVLDATSTRPEFITFFTAPFTIPPFGTVELPVQFAPVNPGVFAAELIVTSDDPDRTQIRVPVLGRSEPSITVSPSHVLFGTVVLGQATSRRVGVTNRGNAPLILSGVDVADAAFTANVEFLMLNPGEFGAVEVEFQPTEPGDSHGVLSLGFGAPVGRTVVLSLTGSARANP
jgi:hypothetical protein